MHQMLLNNWCIYLLGYWKFCKSLHYIWICSWLSCLDIHHARSYKKLNAFDVFRMGIKHSDHFAHRKRQEHTNLTFNFTSTSWYNTSQTENMLLQKRNNAVQVIHVTQKLIQLDEDSWMILWNIGILKESQAWNIRWSERTIVFKGLWIIVSRRNDSHVTYLIHDRFSFTSSKCLLPYTTNEMDQICLLMVSQAGLGNLTTSLGEMSTSNISTTQRWNEENYVLTEHDLEIKSRHPPKKSKYLDATHISRDYKKLGKSCSWIW